MFSNPLVYTDAGYFKDQQGRVLRLRGVNATGDAKVPPFIGIREATELDVLPQWGINTLRLLFTWEAFQPNSKEEYNQAYLDYYQQVVQWAAERNLYVIVDFHQDAFSRYSIKGCGEGFPAWAVHSSIRLSEPRNDKGCESWGVQMIFDWKHHRAWHHFHRDSEGARSAYLEMVSQVVKALRSYKNVIGYEMMNEPWGTNAELSSMYHNVANAVRVQHPEAILFVAPHALLSSGLLKNSMDKPNLTNFAYAPHFYDPFVIMTKIWFGNSVQNPLIEMLNQAQQWNVPMFLGEYGAPASTVGVRGYTKNLYDWLDRYAVSGAHWNYTPGWHAESKDGWNYEDLSIVDDAGRLRPNFQLRPYPVATSGEPIELSINLKSQSHDMVYRWHNDPALGATEIFMPLPWQNSHYHLSSAGGVCEREPYMLVCVVPEAGPVTLTVESR